MQNVPFLFQCDVALVRNRLRPSHKHVRLQDAAALKDKVAKNNDIINRLEQRIAVLERRMRVVLTEVKRERENPLPTVTPVRAKTQVSEQVLRVAPTNKGHQSALVRFAHCSALCLLTQLSCSYTMLACAIETQLAKLYRLCRREQDFFPRWALCRQYLSLTLS